MQITLVRMAFRCTEQSFRDFLLNDDDFPTFTSDEQKKTESSIAACYKQFKDDREQDVPVLDRYALEKFLLKGLLDLSPTYQCLDSSKPWLCYWIVHSLELLEVTIPLQMKEKMIEFLSRCQSETGGYGGGPGQKPHLAPTYAAVNALCVLNTTSAYDSINRETLKQFLLSRRNANGSFTMHDGGEVDIRGAYCAVNTAKLTCIVCPDLFEGTAEWIVRCQTYEGGFAGEPGLEAHGGYSFCGLAALLLLEKEHLCDVKGLLRWLSFRQMSFEGGFQGRTNKLVDGCYSFWQGGAFPLVHMILAKQGYEALSTESWMFHQNALQEYLLLCCQHPNGGLIDKPGKPRDYYHTCYCLSGLSVAQHFTCGKFTEECVVGDADNKLAVIHPIFNIGAEAAHNALRYFTQLEDDTSQK